MMESFSTILNRASPFIFTVLRLDAVSYTHLEEEIVYEEKEKSVGTGINYVYFGIRSTQKEVLDSNFTEMEVEGEIRRVWRCV